MPDADPTAITSRILSYTDAIREATEQAMEENQKIILMGMGVDDHKAIHGSTRGLAERFPGRVFDTPLCEDAMQGVANGLAMAGYRPIHVYTRFDFALLAANQLINIAAKTRYMFGGRVTCPVVVRVAIGRSWGQGAQHSQGLHAFFAHIPGLKVVLPSTPFMAKGLLLEALHQEDPVLFVEHRLLYGEKGFVPADPYRVRFDFLQESGDGRDVLIVATSQMFSKALGAQEILRAHGVLSTVVDPVSMAWDRERILNLAGDIRRVLVVDCGWTAFGFSAELAAQIAEACKGNMNVVRMGHAPAPCPTAKNLEDLYYPNQWTIAEQAWQLAKGYGVVPWVRPAKKAAPEFRGPF